MTGFSLTQKENTSIFSISESLAKCWEDVLRSGEGQASA